MPQNPRSKVERLRAIERQRTRRRRRTIAASIATAVIGATALTIGLWPSPSASKTTAATPVLAPVGNLTGTSVDGISSGAEQLLFHIHAHLQIYVDGRQRLVPYGIGIVGPYQLDATPDGPFVSSGKAFYWLHTHDETGLIHMEAPIQFTFTLGEFFDMWQQPLSAGQVGPAHGPVTVLVDGKTVTGDPRSIQLTAHEAIQLDVGTVVPFQPFTFPAGT